MTIDDDMIFYSAGVTYIPSLMTMRFILVKNIQV